jgi:hypothetical protein
MRYECELIQDLIPLVKDGIASEESRAAVALHLEECPACREVYETDVRIALPPLDEAASEEVARVTRYGDRIGKRRRVFVALTVVFGIILITAIGLATMFLVTLFAGNSYTTRNVAEYGGYSGHINFELEGFFTTRAIFPKNLPSSATVEDYYYFCNNGLLDNSYQLYLVCSYDADDFAREKERLESLKITFEGETHTPTITDTGFDYRAVVTMFDNQESFEYALIDDEARRVVYVFAQTMGIDVRVVPADYRPQGFQPPQDELAEWGGYCIYYFKIGEGAYTVPGTGHID